MEKELESHQQMNLLKDLELPLARILSKMEEIGIYTDVNDLQRMQQELQEKLELLVQRIHDAAGEEFNINSPKQLGVVLFETLKLPVIKNKNRLFYSSRCFRTVTE